MKVSDHDLHDIAYNFKLLRDQLQRLYRVLGLDTSCITNAERQADSRDYKLQGVWVLQTWRQSFGEKATRRTVIEALHKCRLINAKEKLIKHWTIKSQGKYICEA